MPNLSKNLSLKNIAAISSVAIFFLLDRCLKFLILERYPDSLNLVGAAVRFSLTTNQNIAFSLPLSGQWLNWLITAVIAGLIYAAWPKKTPNHSAFRGAALWLLIAGALSNLADRWLYGYVIDYLEITGLTAFNLADVMIVLGAIALLWQAKKIS